MLAERVTDGLAMLLLMGFGLTLYAPAWPAFFALLALTVAGLLVLQSRALVRMDRQADAQAAVWPKIVPRLMTAYDSSQRLLSWRICCLPR